MRFEIGQQVRINEGRFYGHLGTVIAVRQDCAGTVYTVSFRLGTADVTSVIDPIANNGD